MYLLLLQETLLREMGNFLDSHNIATAEFMERAKIIINESYNNNSLHIGSVSNSIFAVGENAKASGGGTKDSSG